MRTSSYCVNGFSLSFAVLLIASVRALYDATDEVVDLTAGNFQKRVLDDDSVWIVEFYAPWCGHCKSLVPEYKRAAKALKGLVKIGGVDMTQHQSLGAPYNVQGFPTIKIFGLEKRKPSDYNGQRSAQDIVNAAVNEVKRVANARLSGRGGSSGSHQQKSSSPGNNNVVELTDANFEELVLRSKDLWLVEFFAPWCGHCKNLEPHWRAAAGELKGKIKLGALDATVHTTVANQFGIRGFPSIKFFGAGEKRVADATDYDGGRTTSDIVQWAMQKVAENLPPPELKQVLSQDNFDETCKDQQLCVVVFLPHIMDCQSKCRNDYLKMLRELADKFKRSHWGWVWTEAGQQPELEQSFGIGGFGYPAMVAVNARKLKYSTMTGSFGQSGIAEFLRDLSYGKGKTSSVPGSRMPLLATVQPWDGKDAELPVLDELDEVDVSDVDLDEPEEAVAVEQNAQQAKKQKTTADKKAPGEGDEKEKKNNNTNDNKKKKLKTDDEL